MDLLSRLFILTIFSPMKENKKFSHKCIHPKHFRVSGIKISNVTKETLKIAADTVALMETANQFSQSLWELFHRCRI